jgi:hypothetical protein
MVNVVEVAVNTLLALLVILTGFPFIAMVDKLEATVPEFVRYPPAAMFSADEVTVSVLVVVVLLI